MTSDRAIAAGSGAAFEFSRMQAASRSSNCTSLSGRVKEIFIVVDLSGVSVI